ncbi:MAG TPA: flagellar export chaperone FliS, partial [Bryobacteraceae bacterium]|nr:flagellar export chaperone FliS [Bryobacteraceae bacterium]
MPKDPYLESRILAADPVELIHILYEHAISQVRMARAALRLGDIQTRATASSKAMAAIGELEGALNFDAGGSISQNLARLYRHMRKRIVDASVKRDDQPLAEVETLLQTLDEGWTAMQHAKPAPAASPYSAAAEPVSHSWNA